MPKPYEQYRKERDQMEAQVAREAEERKRQNDAARAAWLAKLENEKAERRAADEAKLEEALTPERTRLMREWLANTGKTEKDFMRDAWPHLRVNVIEERERAIGESIKKRLRASGQYSF